MAETTQTWPKRILEGCARISLALAILAKGSILLVAPLWLIASILGSADAVWWTKNVWAGFALVAVCLYFTFGCFLPDDAADRERFRAERTKRYAALVQAMEQPAYWSDGSQSDFTCGGPALLASLHAEGFDPAEVMTLANYLARKAVKKELESHGFSHPADIPAAHVSAAARAMFDARADALTAEAKARLTDNRQSARS